MVGQERGQLGARRGIGGRIGTEEGASHNFLSSLAYMLEAILSRLALADCAIWAELIAFLVES